MDTHIHMSYVMHRIARCRPDGQVRMREFLGGRYQSGHSAKCFTEKKRAGFLYSQVSEAKSGKYWPRPWELGAFKGQFQVRTSNLIRPAAEPRSVSDISGIM